MPDTGIASAAPLIAARLADFAADLSYDNVPQRVRERAKLQMLDAIGAALASSSYDFGRCALAALRSLGEGDADVIGMPQRLPLRDAVLVNGILVHGLDYDDTHTEGRVHASGPNLPCALGVAAHVNADGRDLLTAYLIGMEATIRLGAVAKGGFQAAGWHPTGVVGAFGCALGAGKLLGLTAKQLVMAQGIAFSTCAGTSEFVPEAAWTKRMHAGWAGVGGITAALLAREGYTGPRTPYEGERGLYRTYLGPLFAQCDLARAEAGLGETWEIERVSVKPLPACHFNHAHIDATIALATEHGIQPAQVAGIRALVPRAAVGIVCEPMAAKRRPADGYGALFSIYYDVATALVRRRFTLQDIEPDALNDPQVQALADKVDYEIDPQSTFPRHYSGAVVIRLKDGREFSRREDVNRGSAERPLSAHEIRSKFLENAARVMQQGRADRIADMVLDVDRNVNARALSRALGAGA